MGNRATWSLSVFVSLVSAFLLIIPLTTQAATPRVLINRLCDRQAALGSRLIVHLIDPALCGTAAPKPTLVLNANPTSVTQGAPSTLSWATTAATSCTASNGWTGTKAINGEESVSPQATTTYSLSCTGAGGTVTKSVTVNVTAIPVPQPALLLSANPTSVTENGTSTLSWDSTNATACIASNGWSGAKNLDGSEVVTVSATTTYTLACGNGTSTSTQSVTVHTTPTPVLQPTVDISANPVNVTPGAGSATSTLTWTTAHADVCVATGGWTGTKAVNGNEIVQPSATTTYTLECGNEVGTSTDSVTLNFVPQPEEPAINHLVISEVYYDVASSTAGSENSNEWVEIYNPTANSVDLQGWFVGDASSTDMINVSASISSGGYAVIVASTTPAGIPGGVPVIVLSSSIGNNGFANGGDGAVLRDAANTLIDSVGYGTNTSVSPHVSIPDTTDGHSLRRTQLTSDTDTAADWEDVATPTPGQ